MNSVADLQLGVMPAAPGQIESPIDFIYQEHDRQQRLCDQLEAFLYTLDVESASLWSRALRSFLTEDLPMHIADEEADLFPILARRCRGREDIEQILQQLSAEHELDGGLVAPIVKDLDDIVARGVPAQPARFLMDVRAFTETQRRHLVWENGVVLSLANKVLTDGDKRELSRRMAARRGITLPS